MSQLANSATTNIVYDTGGCFENGVTVGWHDEKLQQCEIPIALVDGSLWKGQVNVFFFKNSGISTYKGFTQQIGDRYSIVFTTDSGSLTKNCVGHEIGHQLRLSTRMDIPNDPNHDDGLPPSGTGTLMRPFLLTPSQEPLWIRQEDWIQANKIAHNK